jgi:hypothetical protein
MFKYLTKIFTTDITAGAAVTETELGVPRAPTFIELFQTYGTVDKVPWDTFPVEQWIQKHPQFWWRIIAEPEHRKYSESYKLAVFIKDFAQKFGEDKALLQEVTLQLEALLNKAFTTVFTEDTPIILVLYLAQLFDIDLSPKTEFGQLIKKCYHLSFTNKIAGERWRYNSFYSWCQLNKVYMDTPVLDWVLKEVSYLDDFLREAPLTPEQKQHLLDNLPKYDYRAGREIIRASLGW